MVKIEGFDKYSRKIRFIKFKIIEICNKLLENLNRKLAKAKV